MATAITFASAGRDGALVQIVDESPEEVLALVRSSEDGTPVKLTADGKPVFVNRATIAFWRLHGQSDPTRSQ